MESYKLLGLVSIVWIWMCLLYLVRKWPGDKTMTFSAHAARTRASILFYLVTFSVHLITFYLFFYNWFVLFYDLPIILNLMLAIAVLGEFVALLVPTTGGKMTVVHNIASYIMLVLLLPISIIIANTNSVSGVVRFTSLVAVICMIIVGIVALLQRKGKSNQLVYQIIYGGSFHIIFLVAIFS